MAAARSNGVSVEEDNRALAELTAGARVSGNTFRSELATISTTPILQCYLTALDPVDFGVGGGSQTMAASGAAAWTRLRVEGLSITQYVTSKLKFAPTAATLTEANQNSNSP